jgi:transcription termination factor Rho
MATKATQRNTSTDKLPRTIVSRSPQGKSVESRDSKSSTGDRGWSRSSPEGTAETPRTVRINDTSSDPPAAVPALGVLEMHPKGYGFLRDANNDFRPATSDIFVPAETITTLGLRVGCLIRGEALQLRPGEGPRLETVHDVDGCPAGQYRQVPDFADRTPITPESWLKLEVSEEPITLRILDLLTPLGKGQRGLIVAPPRSGKTILLQQIGQAIATNHPDVELFVLLVDERPEEVTEMRRHIRGRVLASSLDQDLESHVRLSRLVIERCKRLVEQGRDVFLLIDSITRLARAFNKWVGNTGRTMTGGLDVKALDIPKRMFATARAFEEGGSLTILATALVETGSRMDDLIFEEFKGTGNMELSLDRRLADRRVWPAMDITRSGTRREEKLLDPATLQAVTLLRRTLNSMDAVEAMERLTRQLAQHPSNKPFLQLIQGRAARDA